MLQSYGAAKLLFTAVRLDVFTRLDGESLTDVQLARRLGCAPRPTGSFLDALAALGYLRKRSQRYSNTPFARNHLVRRSPRYMGEALAGHDRLWDAWTGLEKALRSDRPVERLEDPFLDKDAAGQLAALVPSGGAQALLQVGAGMAACSAAFLRVNPRLKAVVLDEPEQLARVRKLVALQPRSVRRRLRLRVGRLTGQKGRYDLLLLSHQTHRLDEAANRRLIAEAARRLAPGGRLILHDFMTTDDGTAPLFSAMLSTVLLVSTQRGRVHSVEKCAGWLRSAGFHSVRRLSLRRGDPNASWALVATRG